MKNVGFRRAHHWLLGFYLSLQSSSDILSAEVDSQSVTQVGRSEAAMNAAKFDVAETGVLTASAEQWEKARSRFTVLSELMDQSSIGTSVVEDAAQQWGM